jgi:hypothetical protein
MAGTPPSCASIATHPAAGHPLLKAEGFTVEDYRDFLNWGKAFFVSIRDSIQKKIQVENYHSIPLWDDIFD